MGNMLTAIGMEGVVYSAPLANYGEPGWFEPYRKEYRYMDGTLQKVEDTRKQPLADGLYERPAPGNGVILKLVQGGRERTSHTTRDNVAAVLRRWGVSHMEINREGDQSA